VLLGKLEKGWLADHPHDTSLQNVNLGVKVLLVKVLDEMPGQRYAVLKRDILIRVDLGTAMAADPCWAERERIRAAGGSLIGEARNRRQQPQQQRFHGRLLCRLAYYK
jgi:hypothetical protein